MIYPNSTVKNVQKTSSHFNFSDKRVLVIDDSIMIIQSLRGVLREIGFKDINIQHSETASKALYLSRQMQFDCILCDYNLVQGLNGKQFFEEIQHYQLQSIGTVFIMITGESRRTIVNGIAELMPDEYILKPYTFKQLQAKIARSIERRHTLMPILKTFAAKDYQSALSECERLLMLKVGFTSDIQLMKARLLLELERADEAKELYGQLVKENVGIWSQLGLANSMAALNQYDDAQALLHELLEEDNQQVAALNTAATIFLQNNEIPSAIEYFKLASNLSPTNPDRELVTANLCVSVGDFNSALGHYTRYLELSINTYRETPSAYLNPIRMLLYMAEHKESRDEAISLTIQARQQLAAFNQQHYKPEIAGDIATIYAHIAMQGDFISKAVALLQNSLKEPRVDDFYSHAHMASVLAKFGFEKLYVTTIEQCKHRLQETEDKIIAQSQIAILLNLQERVSKNNQLVSEQLKKGEAAEQQERWHDALELYRQLQQGNPFLPNINLGLLRTLAHAWPSDLSREQIKQLLEHCDKVLNTFLSDANRNAVNYPAITAQAWRNFGLRKRAG